MKIAKELAKEAKKFNICKDWHDELLTLDDKKAMVKMYLKGIDFCLANDYPSNDYIKKNFGDVINDYNIFVDDEVDLINAKKCVALGSTNGLIKIDNFNVCEVFAKHESVLYIYAKDSAFIMVDAFDNSVVNIDAVDNAKVCVNRFGSATININKTDTAAVKIVEKNKKTY